MHGAVLLCNHSGVCYRENLQEIVDLVFSTVVAGIFQFTTSVEALLVCNKLTVGLTTNPKSLEFHNVLSQGSGLVGKDVPDLAQLLAQIRRTHTSREVQLFPVHFQIVFDEVGLPCVAPLHGRVQRYRHHVGVENAECKPVAEPIWQYQVWWSQIPQALEASFVEVEHRIAQQSKQAYGGEHHQHDSICDALQVGLLARSLACVHDHACLRPGVNDDAQAAARVPQHCAPQKQLLRPEGLIVRARGKDSATAEIVDRSLRGLNLQHLDLTEQLGQRVFQSHLANVNLTWQRTYAALLFRKLIVFRSLGGGESLRADMLCRRHGRLQLQIGFAVQVRSGDVTRALRTRTKKRHEISGELLVVLDMEYITNCDILPFRRLLLARPGHTDRCLGVGRFVCLASPFVIQEGDGGRDGHHWD
mmetsp:Transcript_26453/g.66595  ORF Transcript_26453/g.66595 Transcript_26453/m.66595 type:complete len:417 (+) Transcript_26453:1245-2495(+)